MSGKVCVVYMVYMCCSVCVCVYVWSKCVTVLCVLWCVCVHLVSICMVCVNYVWVFYVHVCGVYESLVHIHEYMACGICICMVWVYMCMTVCVLCSHLKEKDVRYPDWSLSWCPSLLWSALFFWGIISHSLPSLPPGSQKIPAIIIGCIL